MNKFLLFVATIVLSIGAGFGITGAYADSAFADLTWVEPITRTDGYALDPTEIGGYIIYESTDMLTWAQVQSIQGNATSGTVVYTLEPSATPYTFYYVVTTVDVDNRESPYSEVVRKDFLLGSAANPSQPSGVGGSVRAGPGYVVTDVTPTQ